MRGGIKMLQYKTICLPLSQKKGIKAKKYYRSLISIENVTKAMEPVSATIQSETMAGWSLHSISSVPIRTARNKSIREFLFGWIPLLSRFLFGDVIERECKTGVDVPVYVLVFVKEV